MFQVNRAENYLERLPVCRFNDLGIREREHLQEWLASTPSALGEELLIIQKEFDGFYETRERLDLLALDKSGQLVVIENKLDDSGRDVVWQALKYAAYCSSLKKAQILDIFQAYLDQHLDGGNAKEQICDFLEVEEFDEVVLNEGNGQRLIFVAAHFRKEATAPVLWLIGHGIRAQCFKVTPYSFGDQLFVDLQQIIPTPEAEEFMIGMASKDDEEKSAKGAQKTRHALRLAFWEQCLEAMLEAGVEIYRNVSPSTGHWLNGGSGLAGCPYTLIFSKDEARVQFEFNRSDRDENKRLFDLLEAKRDQVENRFGTTLTWKRLDNKKSSRVELAKSFDGFNKEIWPDMVAWLVEHIKRLEDSISPHISRLRSGVRSNGSSTSNPDINE